MGFDSQLCAIPFDEHPQPSPHLQSLGLHSQLTPVPTVKSLLLLCSAAAFPCLQGGGEPIPVPFRAICMLWVPLSHLSLTQLSAFPSQPVSSLQSSHLMAVSV